MKERCPSCRNSNLTVTYRKNRKHKNCYILVDEYDCKDCGKIYFTNFSIVAKKDVKIL